MCVCVCVCLCKCKCLIHTPHHRRSGGGVGGRQHTLAYIQEERGRDRGETERARERERENERERERERAGERERGREGERGRAVKRVMSCNKNKSQRRHACCYKVQV